jgi:anti-sigma regulatory factor (Ser/Thr protein kinase)
MLLFTDGLVERRGERLSVGLERLAAAADGNGTPEQVCTRVLRRLVPRADNLDDVALLAVQNAPVPEVLHLRYPAEPTVLAPMRVALRRWMRQHGVPEAEMVAAVLACGDAAANAVEHAYSPETASFEVRAHIEDGTLVIAIRDAGNWRPPRGENRGRGLFIMDRAMDEFSVNPTPNGTEVLMRRRIAS